MLLLAMDIEIYSIPGMLTDVMFYLRVNSRSGNFPSLYSR